MILDERKTFAVTKGMRNMLGRGDVARECGGCGLKVKKYPGRYPSSCPSCEGELTNPSMVAPEMESSARFVSGKLKELKNLLEAVPTRKGAENSAAKLLKGAKKDIEHAMELLSSTAVGDDPDFELELDGVVQVLDSVIASL